MRCLNYWAGGRPQETRPSGSGTADQDHVALIGHEAAGEQFPDQPSLTGVPVKSNSGQGSFATVM